MIYCPALCWLILSCFICSKNVIIVMYSDDLFFVRIMTCNLLGDHNHGNKTKISIITILCCFVSLLNRNHGHKFINSVWNGKCLHNQHDKIDKWKFGYSHNWSTCSFFNFKTVKYEPYVVGFDVSSSLLDIIKPFGPCFLNFGFWLVNLYGA